MLKLTAFRNCLNIKKAMQKRPQIGITMRLDLAARRFYLGRDYSEAIEAYGASPVHISLIPDRDYIASVLEGLDGILLPGSDTDADPQFYGEEPLPGLKKVIREKDETDLLVLAEAERRELPVLAICYGMQILNVSRGGSLFQDIGTQVPEAIKHEQGEPLDRDSHRVTFTERSLLGQIALDGKSEFIRVNTHHHQAIKRIGEHLRVSARAIDGIIEGIEDTRANRFVIGVQWHPELSWRSGASSRLFGSFVRRCENGTD